MYYYGNNIIGIYMLSYPPCDIVYNMSIKTHNEYVICIYYVINYFRVKSPIPITVPETPLENTRFS